MTTVARWRSVLFWSVIVALLIYRPLFTLGIPFAAFPHAIHDDGLFLRSALELRNGNWLGAYGTLTLCKGPFYPMFVVAASRCPIPLPVIEQAFYSLIALIAVWAVRPAISNRWLLLGGLALLILNPYSWGPLPPRLSRDTMAGQLALLCAAGAIGLVFRRDRGTAEAGTWGALAGVAGAACWMTREEGIWIVGPMAALLAVLVILVIREHRPRRLRRVCLVASVPILLGVLPVLSVCEQNRRHYDLFAVVDLKAREFEDAYGALLRVGQAHYRHYVPVPATARSAMYEVSPTFRQLQPLLEGELGRQWMHHRQMPDPQDIQGGWFIWAFRDAAASAAGVSGAPPLDFYSRIAAEINAACDAGTIAAGPRRSGLTTPLHRDDIPELARSLGSNLWALLVWPQYGKGVVSSDNASPLAIQARELVHAPLTGPHNQFVMAGWACAGDGPVTLSLLKRNGARGKFKPQWLSSPDVAQALRQGGKDWASAEQCRFIHSSDLNATHLLIYRADREVARLPLRGEQRWLITDEVAASIDSLVDNPVPVIGDHMLPFQFLNQAVCYAATALAAITIVWFGVGFYTIRRNSLWLCMTGAVAAAILLRCALLAFVNATTYPVFEQRYVEPTYTVLAFLMFLAACALWQHFRRAKAVLNESAPQTIAAQE